MSTKEMAFNIFSQLNEKQLQAFVDLFGRIYQPQVNQISLSEKEKAFNDLQKIIKPIPNIDEKIEIEQYRNKRFAI